MSTPTIRAALERLLTVCDIDESNVLDIDPDLLLDAIVDARAALQGGAVIAAVTEALGNAYDCLRLSARMGGLERWNDGPG